MELDEKKIREDKGLVFEDSFLDDLLKLNRSEYIRLEQQLKLLGIPKGELREAMKARENQIAIEILNGKKDEIVPVEITEKAQYILEHEDPLQYIADSCGKVVLGAEKAFKKLACCVACQDIKRSRGLHPKASGESGMGKSLIVYTFAHRLPTEFKIMGSMSNMSAFYHNDGSRLFRVLDDYRSGNVLLDSIIKQTSTMFHQPYVHRTVTKIDGANKGVILTVGAEQTWVLTSVLSGQDIQVLNRQLPINVNESDELTKKVNRQTLHQYNLNSNELYAETEDVQVCREIWRILKSEGYINVGVPFVNRIEWLDTHNRRDVSMFMDVLISITSIYRYQRQKDELTGEYMATIEDFNKAYELFADKNTAEELVHKMTASEAQLAHLLSMFPNGLTMDEAAGFLKVSSARIRQLALGEKGDDIGGLSQKLAGFRIEKVSDTIIQKNGTKRTTQKTILKLEKYDPIKGIEAIVVLHPEPHDQEVFDDMDDDMRDAIRIYYSDGKRYRGILEEDEPVDIHANRYIEPDEYPE